MDSGHLPAVLVVQDTDEGAGCVVGNHTTRLVGLSQHLLESRCTLVAAWCSGPPDTLLLELDIPTVVCQDIGFCPRVGPDFLLKKECLH